jgi:hypothetical protein
LLGLLKSLGFSFVLLSDFIELLHVFKEFWASVQSNEQLGFLAISSISLDGDGLGLNLLECSVLVSIGYSAKICGNLPNKVFGGDDTGGYSITEGVELNGGVCLKVLLAEEDVEVRVLLCGHVDLVGVLWS